MYIYLYIYIYIYIRILYMYRESILLCCDKKAPTCTILLNTSIYKTTLGYKEPRPKQYLAFTFSNNSLLYCLFKKL